MNSPKQRHSHFFSPSLSMGLALFLALLLFFPLSCKKKTKPGVAISSEHQKEIDEFIKGVYKRKNKNKGTFSRKNILEKVEKISSSDKTEVVKKMKKITDLSKQLKAQKNNRDKAQEIQKKLMATSSKLEKLMKKLDPDEKIAGLMYLEILAKEDAKFFLEVIQQLEESTKVANEASAVASMRALFSAEMQFKILKKKVVKRKSSYATLKELAKARLIDSSLASGERNGYIFTLKVSDKGDKFTATAIPKSKKEGERSFFVNQRGAITTTKDGSIPNAKSKVLY